MSRGGVLAVSMLVASFILFFMDAPITNNIVSPMVRESGLFRAQAFQGNEIFSIAFGKIVVYFILTLAIYLFIRSVYKSFSHRGHGSERVVSRYS